MMMAGLTIRRFAWALQCGVLVVLARVATGVSAQQQQGSPLNCSEVAKPGADYVASSRLDISALEECGVTSIPGNFFIRNTDLAEVRLNTLQRVSGELEVRNSSTLQSISAPNLVSIGPQFKLDGLTQLTTLDLPSLRNVSTYLNWVNLPKFKNVSIPARSLQVWTSQPFHLTRVLVNGTGLRDLDFLELSRLGAADAHISINNNPFLDSVTFTDLHKAAELTFTNNSRSLNLTLPDLDAAGAILIRDAREVHMPELITVSAEAVFQSNYLVAISFPSLAGVTSSLVLADNSLLEVVDFPSLTNVGTNCFLNSCALTVTNNSALATVNGFNRLRTARVNFSGPFANVSLPALDHPNRELLINSTIAAFDCTPWDLLNSAQTRQLKPPEAWVYRCVVWQGGKDVAKHAINTTPALSKDVIGSIGAIGGIVVLLFLWLTVWWLRRRYSNARYRSRQAAVGIELQATREAASEVTVVGSSASGGGNQGGGVVRRSEEDENGESPPSYRRRPKPGEVPPGYVETVRAVPSNAPSNTETEVETQPEPPAPLPVRRKQ